MTPVRTLRHKAREALVAAHDALHKAALATQGGKLTKEQQVEVLTFAKAQAEEVVAEAQKAVEAFTEALELAATRDFDAHLEAKAAAQEVMTEEEKAQFDLIAKTFEQEGDA